MSLSRALVLMLVVPCCAVGCAGQTRHAPPAGSPTPTAALPAPTPPATATRMPTLAPDHEAVRLGPDGQPLPKFGDYVYVEELPEAITRVAPAYPTDARRSG